MFIGLAVDLPKDVEPVVPPFKYKTWTEVQIEKARDDDDDEDEDEDPLPPDPSSFSFRPINVIEGAKEGRGKASLSASKVPGSKPRPKVNLSTQPPKEVIYPSKQGSLPVARKRLHPPAPPKPEKSTKKVNARKSKPEVYIDYDVGELYSAQIPAVNGSSQAATTHIPTQTVHPTGLTKDDDDGGDDDDVIILDSKDDVIILDSKDGDACDFDSKDGIDLDSKNQIDLDAKEVIELDSSFENCAYPDDKSEDKAKDKTVSEAPRLTPVETPEPESTKRKLSESDKLDESDISSKMARLDSDITPNLLPT